MTANLPRSSLCLHFAAAGAFATCFASSPQAFAYAYLDPQDFETEVIRALRVSLSRLLQLQGICCGPLLTPPPPPPTPDPQDFETEVIQHGYRFRLDFSKVRRL